MGKKKRIRELEKQVKQYQSLLTLVPLEDRPRSADAQRDAEMLAFRDVRFAPLSMSGGT